MEDNFYPKSTPDIASVQQNEHKHHEHRCEEPYPDLKRIKPNRYYADILSFDFAGYSSELTAILTYTYQSYMLKHIDEHISEELMRIAISEMHHHEILGEMIIMLGGDPIFANSRGQFWTGRYVDYCKGTKRMLLMDIEGEMKAIEGYKKAISMINDETIKAILERIILDEKHHIKVLEKLLNKVTGWD